MADVHTRQNMGVHSQDRRKLWWAQINLGKEKQSAHERKIMGRPADARYSDVERESAVLEQVLQKVRTSTG